MKNPGIKKSMFVLLLITICTASALPGSVINKWFPDEMLYMAGPEVSVRGLDGQYKLSIINRFLVDTPFNYTVDDPVIAGLMQTESSFILHSVSSADALGPFQMKPFFADEIGVLNPFNPYADKKVKEKLVAYEKELGNMDLALGAYRIGFYGVKKMINDGKNPLNDSRISDYVNKNAEYKRQYVSGSKVRFKDYIWSNLFYSIGEERSAGITVVVPEFFLGSVACGIEYVPSDLVVDNSPLSISLSQDIVLTPFMNLYAAYKDGFLFGVSLKSGDWSDKAFIVYDLSGEDLFWMGINRFDWFSLEYGFSKDSVFVNSGFEINNRVKLRGLLKYKDFTFIPGIEFVLIL